MIGTMCVPPTQILLLYISFELIVPKKKWHLISIYLVLGTAFELFLLLDPMGSITYIYPDSPGEDLINSQLIFGSPLFIIYIIFSMSILSGSESPGRKPVRGGRLATSSVEPTSKKNRVPEPSGSMTLILGDILQATSVLDCCSSKLKTSGRIPRITSRSW